MSTALSPQFFLPDWMKSVSAYNPVSITVDAIRALVIGPGWTNVWNPLITAYAVIALIAIVTLGATMYLFRKVIG
jgi:ABC-type polysaccharide/polyol phosphate export permease